MPIPQNVYFLIISRFNFQQMITVTCHLSPVTYLHPKLSRVATPVTGLTPSARLHNNET